MRDAYANAVRSVRKNTRVRLISTRGELRHQVGAARARDERVGLVISRAGLHDGHLSVLRVARAQCDFVVACPYAYHRFVARPKTVRARRSHPQRFARTVQPTLTSDPAVHVSAATRAIAQSAGADILWTDANAELATVSQYTRVVVDHAGAASDDPQQSAYLAALVTRWIQVINIVQPDVVYIGAKHLRETALLCQAISDLALACDVRVVPTAYAPDGLPLGTAIAQLNSDQRLEARALPAMLAEVSQRISAGERSPWRIRAQIEAELGSSGVTVESVDILHGTTLQPVDRLADGAIIHVTVSLAGIQISDWIPVPQAENSEEALDAPTVFADTGV